MNEHQRSQLVNFLVKRNVLGKFKECIEKFGQVKNFYVFCDGVPVELAFRSAFPWDMCDIETINGMKGNRFWEHLNGMWQLEIAPTLRKEVPAVVNGDKSVCIRVMALLFRIYRCPNSAKKFGTKIGAPEEEVKMAMELAKSKSRLFESDFRIPEPGPEPEPVQVEKVEEKEPEPETVDYDWSNLTGVGNGRRGNGNRGGYPDGMMFRVRRGQNKGYVILFSKYISDFLRERGCDDSMSMFKDRATNQLVFVFGKGKDYNLSQYLTDGSMKVQNVAIVNTVESYVNATFQDGVNYFVPVQKIVHSKDMKQVAMVVTNRYQMEP